MGYYSARLCLGVHLYDEDERDYLDDVIINGTNQEDWQDIAEFIEYDDASPFCGQVETMPCGYEGQNGIIMAVKDTIHEVVWGEVKSLNSPIFNEIKEEQWQVVFDLTAYLKKCGITPLNSGVLLSAYYG